MECNRHETYCPSGSITDQNRILYTANCFSSTVDRGLYISLRIIADTTCTTIQRIAIRDVALSRNSSHRPIIFLSVRFAIRRESVQAYCFFSLRLWLPQRKRFQFSLRDQTLYMYYKSFYYSCVCFKREIQPHTFISPSRVTRQRWLGNRALLRFQISSLGQSRQRFVILSVATPHWTLFRGR